MTKRASVFAAGWLLGSLAWSVGMPAAHATFPGRNGVIVFVDYLPGDSAIAAIFTVNPDGSDRRQITAGTARLGERTPSVSADGARIAFSRELGHVDDVWVMNIDGSEQRRVTFGKRVGKPAWSPDATRIAVGVWPSSGIGVMRADGSDYRVLRADNSDQPYWSPDGTQLSFIRSTLEGHFDIYLMRPDGSDVRRLTDSPTPDFGGDWSPDGTQLAFASWRDAEFGDIYVMRADGSNQTRIAALPFYDTNPIWSPDGKLIAWEHCGWGQDGAEDDIGIYVANADGTAMRKVVSTRNCTGSYPSWQALPGPREVAIAISTCQDHDVVRLSGRDQLEVAFLSQDGFDARSIDPSTACFGSAHDVGARDCMPRRTGSGLYDVDGDGDLDLTLTFRGRESGLAREDTHACARAMTRDGEEIEGCREVVVTGRS